MFDHLDARIAGGLAGADDPLVGDHLDDDRLEMDSPAERPDLFSSERDGNRMKNNIGYAHKKLLMIDARSRSLALFRV